MTIKNKTYPYLLIIIFISLMTIGCSDNKKEDSKTSFIEGIFDSSEKEKAHTKKMKAQSKNVQEQVDQLQQNRLNSY